MWTPLHHGVSALNIFLTDPDPYVCAIALDDVRVVKMAVESAQLLATSLRLQGIEDDGIYKATHTAHPCSKWARRTRSNFLWLVEHGLELCREYSFRYDGRVHKSAEAIRRCYALRESIPVGPLVLGPVDVGGFNSSGFDTGDVTYDYKLCMVNKWRHLDGNGGATGSNGRSRKPAWTFRGPPAWKRDLWATDFNNP